jgi:2-oxoglutarate ferredoxin oxidoreductase subunit alpha
VLTAEDLQKLGSFKRYADVDGDGIGYRTLPGTKHPAAAYFTRGSGHNASALYSERPDDYKNNMDRLFKKYDTARSTCRSRKSNTKNARKSGFLAFGTTHWAIIRIAGSKLQKEIKEAC